jgi:hypothetical protein
MSQRRYFKDHRTGAVYVTTERTLPTEGRIPVKPAYKSDTVWLDRAYADSVPDPHIWSGGRLLGFLATALMFATAWFFGAYGAHNELHTSLANALFLMFGWYALIWSYALRAWGFIKI